MSKYVITVKKDKDAGEEFWKQGSLFTYEAKIADSFEEAKKIFRESIVSLKVSLKKAELENVFEDDYNDLGKPIFDLVNGVCKDPEYTSATSFTFADSDWDGGMGFDVSKDSVAVFVPFADDFDSHKTIQFNCANMIKEDKTYFFNYAEDYDGGITTQKTVILKKVQD